MDLGAMVCTPKDPQCARCPLHRLCKGKASGNPERFPSRGVKKAIPSIEAVSAVIQKNGQVLLRQRPAKGLLGGLWEFPNWKVDHGEDSDVKLLKYIKNELGIRIKTKESLGSFKHTYSHFKLTLHVYLCHIPGGKKDGTWVPVRDLHLYPMSRLHRRIAQTLGEKFQKCVSQWPGAQTQPPSWNFRRCREYQGSFWLRTSPTYLHMWQVWFIEDCRLKLTKKAEPFLTLPLIFET